MQKQSSSQTIWKEGSSDMEEKTIEKTHRIGSVTFGAGLILFGSLFLVHLFIPALSYELIFHLWPCLFILLGVEVLIGNWRNSEKFVYDKPAIALTVFLTLFAMGMGLIDWCMQQYGDYISMHW